MYWQAAFGTNLVIDDERGLTGKQPFVGYLHVFVTDTDLAAVFAAGKMHIGRFNGFGVRKYPIQKADNFFIAFVLLDKPARVANVVFFAYFLQQHLKFGGNGGLVICLHDATLVHAHILKEGRWNRRYTVTPAWNRIANAPL